MIKILQAELSHKDAEIARMDAELKKAHERIAWLTRHLFSSKRDKAVCDERQLEIVFEEFETAVKQHQKELQKATKQIKAEAEKRRGERKRPTNRPETYRYAGLEERRRREQPADVNPDDYDEIGCDTERILHQEPPKFWVEVVERPVFRLKADRNRPNPTIVQAPKPHSPIGGGHVAADFLARMVVDKYVYHIPEYRQIKRWADQGLRIPSSTVNGWMHAVALKLDPLYERQCALVRSRSYLQIDEVPWRIADRQGKCRHGYAWQFFDATPDSHGLYFYYLNGSRAGTIPRAQLRHFNGAIQTDGYKVYDFYEHIDNVTLLGCMAHVRRKFIEAQRAGYPQADVALENIATLYQLEANLKAAGATPAQIAAERAQKGLPIIEAMESWMLQVSKSQCTPRDLMGRALDYAFKMWPRIRNYALDGTYQIDNNGVERNQRPSVMGRKNYLFSKSDGGAVDNAVFYTLLQSCAIVGLNQLEWLTAALDSLSDDMTDQQLFQLLPYNYKKSQSAQ